MSVCYKILTILTKTITVFLKLEFGVLIKPTTKLKIFNINI